jgi:hypothetical protein
MPSCGSIAIATCSIVSTLHHAASGSMNMLVDGVENPDITYRNSLARDQPGKKKNTRWCWPIRRFS